MIIDDACQYVKITMPGDRRDEGNVHLVATLPIKEGRAKRAEGEFICSPAYGRNVNGFRPAQRDEFMLEPCPKCIKEAEKLGISVGVLWQDIPGDKVVLYTTSPEERDLPYASGGKVVGEYYAQDVRRIVIPEVMIGSARRWYQRDQYFCWDEQTWKILLGAGRAEPI